MNAIPEPLFSLFARIVVMEHRLGTPLESKAVFVRSPGAKYSGSIPVKPLFSTDASRPDVQHSPFSADRIFSDAVLQWWDLHAGYFGYRPARDS